MYTSIAALTVCVLKKCEKELWDLSCIVTVCFKIRSGSIDKLPS